LRQLVSAKEVLMRQFVSSLFILILAGSAGYAQNLEGVYSPPVSSTGHLRGIFGAPQSAPAAAYGAPGPVPSVRLPGSGDVVGQVLPEGVKPSPMPDRPGYGRATVNGHSAIVDMGSNRIVQYSD
jgi:hypothetical protein